MIGDRIYRWYFDFLAWYRVPPKRLTCCRCGAKVRTLEEGAWHMSRAHAEVYRGQRPTVTGSYAR